MSDPDQPPTPERLTDLLEDGSHEETVACLDRLEAADPGTRKRVLRTVREGSGDRPCSVAALSDRFSAFLSDEDRAVRLTTAKLFVTLARSDATAVLSAADAIAGRLADDEEFYYVRARCAEALGYVAVDSPEQVTGPEILADLRIGLSFDEPEVREKLAKALAYVALGDPNRLRHQVDSLAEHLDDENELVRYHLCTAVVVVGCEHPAELATVEKTLRERLADENPYVCGRAAEALGLVAGAHVPVESTPDLDDIDTEGDGTPSFLRERVRFCRRQLADEPLEPVLAKIGTVESVQLGTDDVVEAMTAPEEGECPHCGLSVTDGDPPMCPRCGAPR